MVFELEREADAVVVIVAVAKLLSVTVPRDTDDETGECVRSLVTVTDSVNVALVSETGSVHVDDLETLSLSVICCVMESFETV